MCVHMRACVCCGFTRKLTWHTFSLNYAKAKWMGLDFRVFLSTHAAHTHTDTTAWIDSSYLKLQIACPNVLVTAATATTVTQQPSFMWFYSRKMAYQFRFACVRHCCAQNAAHNKASEEHKAKVTFDDVDECECTCVCVCAFAVDHL